ncbi:hybrid sensor histidine kinase/response regulator [Enterobacter cloacae]|uniref:hybrid sensor histidine kinase/response regulator n=1 Tax=Enterobacter cloacae TaxID=550 RepID=UPI0009F3FC10|nr:hybrid sensor histidine kinase/response regulator [Enterobacter cloacae]MDX7022612.1 hybrid sensor histidine kinase/response regulator [Enterobacter cloacae]ORC19490.1 hybrid sensor histidine kinase/response regulator [Enterobacter cloacae subsp. cloacae]ORC33359.1 hybrid sensor histidine kinase/response regulator [Enterobacter cloacae subsp. cloacae]VAM42429.1 integral membrane sensor hybrid histidine kinase [Enterobacter cloacae]HBH7062193.1 hybrid sensor histidine kinase/response regulat
MRFLQSLQNAGISPPAQIRLLNNTFLRLVFSFSAVPFVGIPFAIWINLLGDELGPTITWIIIYLLCAVAIRILHRRYQREAKEHDEADVLRRWLPRINKIALIHGLGISSLYLITPQTQNFDFFLLLNISIAAIVAANATHLTPVISTFTCFFFASWGVLNLGIIWRLDDLMFIVLMLNLLYGFAIYRHALTSHAFFIQQALLEEKSSRLAEQFRQAKEEAEQALLDKNQFLTTASHDLRQPVHAMGFLIEAIIHRNRDDSLTPQLLDLQQSVRSVHLMFNSLLDLSKIESGNVLTAPARVDIGALLDSVITLFREEANSRALRLRTWRPKRRIYVMGDPLLVRQSLINLIQNALRYTLQGGVLVAIRPRGDGCMVEVWDTGVGIADDEKGKIFSPYYRPELAWKIDSAGHGLGLAVVARCAKLMKVKYGMQSIEGKGSRFWMRFTQYAGDESAPEMRPAYDHIATPVRYTPLHGSCLVVDDDPLVTSAWESLMSIWGINVRCAASAEEAFAIIEDGFTPFAVLCDQRLRSGESGFDILKALFERLPDMSGAMVSGEFNSPVLLEAEQEGYMVLRKPLEPAKLHALLTQWSGSRG